MRARCVDGRRTSEPTVQASPHPKHKACSSPSPHPKPHPKSHPKPDPKPHPKPPSTPRLRLTPSHASPRSGAQGAEIGAAGGDAPS
eukprot:scaffold45971_cov33-Phaeocystis_antarctica.AAC.1